MKRKAYEVNVPVPVSREVCSSLISFAGGILVVDPKDDWRIQASASCNEFYFGAPSALSAGFPK